MSEQVYRCSHPNCFKTSQENVIYIEEIDYSDEDKTFTTCEKHVNHANVVEKIE